MYAHIAKQISRSCPFDKNGSRRQGNLHHKLSFGRATVTTEQRAVLPCSIFTPMTEELIAACSRQGRVWGQSTAIRGWHLSMAFVCHICLPYKSWRPPAWSGTAHCHRRFWRGSPAVLQAATILRRAPGCALLEPFEGFLGAPALVVERAELGGRKPLRVE